MTIAAGGVVHRSNNDSGISPAGQTGCIAPADGSVSPGPFLAPGLTCWSLIGRIGGNPAFEVGTGVSFTATGAGELDLGVNDNYFTDNSGAWTASITAPVLP